MSLGRGIHEARVTTRPPDIGVKVHVEEFLRVNQIAFFDRVEQGLLRFAAVVAFKPGRH